MAPRKRRTTSADRSRNKGKGAKKVTGKTPQSRANRQKASNARVTQSGQGGGRGRVTKKGGAIVKSNARRTAAQTKAGRAAAGTKGKTVRTGQKPGAIVKQTRAQKVKGSLRTGSYAKDIAKLKSLLKKGGRVALSQARALARAIGPRALKAAPGLLVGGAIVGSAGRPNQRVMSKLGLLKAAEYKTPFNQKRTSDKPGVNKGPNRVRPTTPYYGPGGSPSGSGEGQARQRKPANVSGVTSRTNKGGSRGGAGTPPVAKRTAPKPKPKKLTDKQRMVGKSSAERLAVWAKANRKMIEKSGTKKQREILANALKKKK
jgi:hypothetical protein